MEVSVAVIQLRQNAHLSGGTTAASLNLGDFELALTDVTLPSTSAANIAGRLSLPFETDRPTSRQGDDSSPFVATVDPAGLLCPPGVVLTRSSSKPLKQLPKCRMQLDRDPAELALKFARNLITSGEPGVLGVRQGMLIRRAVRIGSWRSESMNTLSGSGRSSVADCKPFGALYCVPVLERDRCTFNSTKGQRLDFFNLAKLSAFCKSNSDQIDVESRHLIRRLEEWLRGRQKTQPRFLTHLFLRSAAQARVRNCAHNPGHEPIERRGCYRQLLSRTANQDGVSLQSSDLEEEKRQGNDALIRLGALDKLDCMVINPLFGSGLGACGLHPSVVYRAKGRPELPSSSRRRRLHSATALSSSSPGTSGSGIDSLTWADRYPLHSAAYQGHDNEIKSLLAQGVDVNAADCDSWTPLHYAAWYGRLGALQALVNFGAGCDANARSRSGSTALHFAAANGHAYAVELLLTHPRTSVHVRDGNGKTPLDLADCNPKDEWRTVVRLLRAASTDKLPKVQVDLMDGSNVMLGLSNGTDTTADVLKAQMLIELRLSDACGHLFALWICSESLELQLKGDHKPMAHLQRWCSKVLTKFSDSPNPMAEQPRLVFRRDARATLHDEKQTMLTDAALALLYDEARQNYIKGRYPCSDDDTVMLAAVLLQIVYGDHDAKKDKQLLANDKTLRQLLPQHKLKHGKTLDTLKSKITSEHKQVTSRAAKSIHGLQYQFLSFCWNLRVYGAAFFDATVFMQKPVRGNLQVHVGVNDYGVHLINAKTKVLFQTYALKTLQWTYHTERTHLDVTVKASPIAAFTIKTTQASFINMLLTKLVEKNQMSKLTIPISM